MKEWYERAPKALLAPGLPDEIYRAAVGATNELVVARFERAQADMSWATGSLARPSQTANSAAGRARLT
jgi:hypothetical protein